MSNDYEEEDYQEGDLYPTSETTLEFLDRLNVKYTVVELDQRPDQEKNPKDPAAKDWSGVYTWFEGERETLVLYYTTGSLITEIPTADQILAGYLEDTSIVEDFTFEQYCREFGYDDNSIRDLKGYNDTIEAQSQIKDFFGEHYQALRETE